MKDKSKYYLTGQQILPGDIISYADSNAEVDFVIGYGEFDDDDNWYKKEFKNGFMIKSEKYGSILLNEADEDVEFTKRKNG
jgi:hypothetical protein